jgi:hypothetical protein
MNLSERFKVCGPNIVHEVIEGEVVIVNMNNGYYYSSENVGSVVWRLVGQGCCYGEIIAALAARYPGSSAEIASTTAQMIEDLRNEGLIIGTENGPDGGVPADAFAGLDGSGFVPPKLHKHKDMQDLLLVDPIHEVETTGWPNIKEAPGDGP